MSLTDRILPRYILSRVRVLVQPSNFFTREKLPKISCIPTRPCVVYFNESPIGYCLASVEKGASNHDSAIVGRTDTATPAVVGGDVRARECVLVCARVCVPACVRDVFAIYDNNILPRLIMIIIKIIFQYFIEIAQMISPQQVYRLVHLMNTMSPVQDGRQCVAAV